MTITIESYQAECDRLLEELSEYIYMEQMVRSGDIIYDLKLSPPSEEKYLSIAYETCPVMVLGCVSFPDWEKARGFLLLLLERYRSGGEIDVQKVQVAAHKIWRKGIESAVKWHLKVLPEDLPIREAVVPSRNRTVIDREREIEHKFNKDNLLYTLDWSDLYGGYPDDDLPSVEGCLFVEAIADTGGEAFVPLGDATSFKRKWGIPMDSVEAVLLLAQFCVFEVDMMDLAFMRTYNHHTSALNKAIGQQYAAIRYDLMGGVWLRPTPAAIADFVKMKSLDYGLFGRKNRSDWDEEIATWLKLIESKITPETPTRIVKLIKAQVAEHC
jgi:hypothetical protein